MKKYFLMPLLSLCVVSTTIQAETFCSLEIGSKGVKARLFEFTGEQDELSIETHYSKEINTSIVASIKEGLFSQEAIVETANAVATLFTEMSKVDKDCKKIAVASSGVSKGSNTDSLRKAVIESSSVDELVFISAEEEAFYGFTAAVPKRFKNTALMVDIGSGNTKIGYYGLGEGKFFAMEVPFGSVSLAKAAIQDGIAPNSSEYNKYIQKKIEKDYSEIVQSRPSVQSRKIVFWIGGAAWATSTWTNPSSATKNYVKLRDRDISNFMNQLDSKSWTSQPVPTLKITAKVKDTFEKDWLKVTEVFTRENLLAGTGIMKSILDNGAQRDSVYFSRNAQWIFGYTIAKYLKD
jgi:hypothetical protein